MEIVPNCEFLNFGFCFCDKSYVINFSLISAKDKKPIFPPRDMPFTISLLDAKNRVVLVRFFFFKAFCHV
jgi:hypothetical protein